MTLLNENPHPCVAFRNLYIESRYLINMFLKFCIDMVFCLLWVGWGKQQLLLSVYFWQETLWQKYRVFSLEKNASTIQYAYIVGASASVLPNTCAWEQYDWNKTKNRVRMQADRVEMEISKAGTK